MKLVAAARQIKAKWKQQECSRPCGGCQLQANVRFSLLLVTCVECVTAACIFRAVGFVVCVSDVTLSEVARWTWILANGFVVTSMLGQNSNLSDLNCGATKKATERQQNGQVEPGAKFPGLRSRVVLNHTSLCQNDIWRHHVQGFASPYVTNNAVQDQSLAALRHVACWTLTAVQKDSFAVVFISRSARRYF